MAQRQLNRNRGKVDILLPQRELIRHTEPALESGEMIRSGSSVESDFIPLFDQSAVAGIVNVEGGGATVEIDQSIDGEEVDRTDVISVAAGTPQNIQIPIFTGWVRVKITANANQTTTRAYIFATTRVSDASEGTP